MTLISPRDLHPATWHVALFVTVDSPGGSALQCDMWLWDDMPLNLPKRLPCWNSTSGYDFDRITAVDMSLWTSLRNFIQIRPPLAEKITSCRFSRWHISAILDFRDLIMGSLKSLCTTSYRSSIETIALNCLVFEKIAFLHFSIQDPRWRMSAILDFRGPVTASLLRAYNITIGLERKNGVHT